MEIIKTENELIEDNIALIKKLAQSFKPKNDTELDDYIQEGRIGLLKAIRHHDPAKGQLSTIAWNSIRWEILRYIERNKNKNHKSTDDIDDGICYNDNIDIDEQFFYLTKQEKQVVQQKLEGNNFTEIGKLNGYSRGWANKIFRGAANKIKNYEKQYEEENTI